MSLLLVIAGLILLLAGAGWFAGAATVGAVLLAAGAVWFLIELVLFILGAASFRRAKRNMEKRRASFDRW